MKNVALSFALFTIAMLAIPASPQTPKSSVEAFYKFDRSHSQVFKQSAIEARKGWFSPELYRLFQYELKREAAYLKKNPTDKPYFGDGLPFQPYDETCKVHGRDVHRSLNIAPAWQKGSRAVVTAAFAYPKGCKDSDTVTYTIGMIRGKSGWVIDDVNYGEDTTLKQRLNRKEY
jgi:hypothetical protein